MCNTPAHFGARVYTSLLLVNLLTPKVLIRHRLYLGEKEKFAGKITDDIHKRLVYPLDLFLKICPSGVIATFEEWNPVPSIKFQDGSDILINVGCTSFPWAGGRDKIMVA